MTIKTKTFIGLVVRCLVTVLFIALVLATTKIYQVKGNFPSAQKAAFNTILVFILIFLGINFIVRTGYVD